MKLDIETQEELEAAIRAVEDIRKTRIRHVGRFPNRANCTGAEGWVNKERIFADHWRKQNENVTSFLNGGYGVLDHLLCADDRGRILSDITQEQATSAATVIQWLGTNCGWCFLEECITQCGYKLRAKDSKA